MNIQITPKKLNGQIMIPPSKSMAHRLIISAALAEGISKISNVYPSKDILATIDVMKTFGADIKFDGDLLVVNGVSEIPEKALCDCCESGSTLRFLIPVACALGISTTFVGKGKLPERPITPYLSELSENGITFDYNNTMPFSVTGKLKSGTYKIAGDISSQFITGLIFALPLVEGDSEIILTSHLESKPYVDITVSALKTYGIDIAETENGYYIKGGQKYMPCDTVVEADYSQAAFFYVLNSLGSDIKICGLNSDSFQGDKKIVEICERIVYNKEGSPNSFKLDCSDIPDLVPVLAVLASFCGGVSEITNVKRLRIKESDRLAAISECLNKIGGKVQAFEDKLVVTGVESLSGGEVDAFNDHRIAMAMAVAATRCTGPLIINGAECVEKSYPNFFEDYIALGGQVEKQ